MFIPPWMIGISDSDMQSNAGSRYRRMFGSGRISSVASSRTSRYYGIARSRCSSSIGTRGSTVSYLVYDSNDEEEYYSQRSR